MEYGVNTRKHCFFFVPTIIPPFVLDTTYEGVLGYMSFKFKNKVKKFHEGGNFLTTNTYIRSVMKMLKSKIGEYIERSGYRKDFVAKKIGVSYRQLAKYITGDSFPTVPKLFALARLLGCKVDDLYEDEENY
jgi:DNA-binding XRE family transcriptional regulator